MNFKIILGIETTCDETGAAVLLKDGDRVKILSNVVASSKDLQSQYGGIIPEQAAREQIKAIIPVIEAALIQAFPNVIPAKAGIQSINSLWIPDRVRDDILGKIDAIAVTQGPGLIGSLLVGVETAKTLALVWQKPLIPVNHLIGHFYANWIEVSRGDSDEGSRRMPATTVRTSDGKQSWQDPKKPTNPSFPCIGLLVSGGHTDLVLFTGHGKYQYLGGTRDDAAGECFDKCARLLGLPYPGGPEIAKLAENGNPKAFNLPRPMIDSANFDFSFSGLKTAVSNLVQKTQNNSENQNTSKPDYQKNRNPDLSDTPSLSESFRNDLCASIEQAIVDPLVKKTIRAVKQFKVSQVIVAGGVASNQRLRTELFRNFKLFIPPPFLCTDNAAMIASAAFFLKKTDSVVNLQADPSLSLRL